jgi:hypothetical protein
MYVVAVTVAFEHRHVVERIDLADALMLVESVATARISADGNSAVYRADIGADSPEDAVPLALEPARQVAAALGIGHHALTAQVEEDDAGIDDPTGRRVVLRSRAYDVGGHRSTTTWPSSTETG